MDGFRTPQAAKATGVNPKTLHYLDRTGFLSPSIRPSHGTGTRRVYSFQDLLALRVARELRDAGVSLQALRRVVAFLRNREELGQYPLAETYLVTDGHDVFADTGKGLISALQEPGQGLLFHVLDLKRTVDELHQATVRLCEPLTVRVAKVPPKAG
jgi:DNA-binding transcriptional MerR regulator